MKKIVIMLLTIGILVVGGYIAYKNFNFDKIKHNIDKAIEKPKLKIFNEDSKSRVIGVTINNHHDAWPHAGLEESFLNYEIIAEGGITRILAFYKDKNAEKIGSVRSARHYFIDYMLENDAIFVHYGHSEKALSDIRSLGIDDINGMFSSAPFYRDKSLNRNYEHTAFTSTDLINTEIAKKELRKTSDKGMLLKYSIKDNEIDKREDAVKADEVFIDYSNYTNTKYIYDNETKLYKRFMDDTAHTDLITGKQYTAKNIIVYKIKNVAIDTYGRQNLENIGSGEGYYISNGYAVPITWSKADRASKTIYKYSDDTEIKVNDGNTWIQIQPENKLLDIIKYEIEEEKES